MAGAVKVNWRGVERVKSGHLWIYRADIIECDAAPGEVVLVQGPRGQALGMALYSSKSQIALRLISTEEADVNRDFWAGRLEAAERLRRQVVSDSTAYRLVYGESDLLPSLIIDRYDDCFVIQTLSQGMEKLKKMWVDLIVERFSPRAVIERNEARVRDLEGLPRAAGLLYGSDPGRVIFEEGGIRFAADLRRGQKTGAFLDQRENRIAAAQYCGQRALDCFTFEGGFALHLARRANSVTAVDISADVIQGARLNAELNQITNVEFVEANAFDWLRELDRTNQRFDLIVLDPPAFAKNRSAVEAAARGYKEINLRAMKLLNSGGILVTSSCSYHMSEERFLKILAEAASDLGRTARIIEKRTQARDHPVLIPMPETHYLKCVILQLLC
jgi:23S rRNA (cytosine1962-C5)-methyltransferase